MKDIFLCKIKKELSAVSFFVMWQSWLFICFFPLFFDLFLPNVKLINILVRCAIVADFEDHTHTTTKKTSITREKVSI